MFDSREIWKAPWFENVSQQDVWKRSSDGFRKSIWKKIKENKNKMTPASVQLAPFSADSKRLRAGFPAAAHSKSQRIGNCGLESTCLAIKSLGESSESDMNYITVY